MLIPNVVPPQEDELLYSWQSRLAKENGFDSLHHFAQHYIYPNCHSAKEESDRRVAVDGREEFFAFAKAITGTDDIRVWAQLYSQTTLYNALAPYLTYIQQIKLTHTAFPKQKNDLSRRTCNPIFQTIQYCPCCVKEELDSLSYWYAHRSHQLPGVTVCHKHGCRLAASPNAPINKSHASEELQYAEFVHQLLQNPRDICWNDIRAETLKRSGKTRAAIEAGISASSAYPLGSSAISDVCANNRYISFQNGVSLTLIFIGDYGEFEKRFPSADNIEHLISLWGQTDVSVSVCDSIANKGRTEESFRQEIKDLTGDQYQLVRYPDSKEGKADIKHLACGTTTSYRIQSFLYGQRCPHCSTVLRDKELAQYIDSLSAGRYQLERREGVNLICLADAETGNKIVLAPSLAVQELTRPTPSKVLPCEARKLDSQRPLNRRNTIKQWALSKRPDELIRIQDAPSAGFTIREAKSVIGKLGEDGRLRRVFSGVYIKPDSKLSTEDVIMLHYVNDSMGYLYGKSFAHQLGLSSTAPDRLYITSNRESQRHGRNINPGDLSVHIRGPLTPITKENVLALQFLDLLQMLSRYSEYDYIVSEVLLLKHLEEHDITFEYLKKYTSHYPSYVKQQLRRLERYAWAK